MLGLAGPNADSEALARLEPAGWEQLASLAEEHRLEPLLHAHISGDATLATAISSTLRSRWADAHRASGLVALAQRADLFATVRLLHEAGIPTVALKGAHLAWYAYPAAALRPLRDIDLLVPAERVLAAWRLLREAGYMAPDGEPSEADIARGKHLPALIAPQGTPIELHLRCWEPSDVALRRMPKPQDVRFLAGAAPAAPDDPACYPAPADMLTHLVMHATGQHLLDTGPLLLSDLDFLLARHAVYWDGWWAAANEGGWARSGALALALTDCWRRPGVLEEARCPVAVPRELLEAAPDLLLQPLADRSATFFLAGLHKPEAALRAKLRARPAGGYARWLVSRLSRTVRDIANSETRRRVRQAAQFGAWLSSRD